MGCWNGTCFFSGLPIIVGDPAVIFPITTDDCSSVLYPIYGEYDDYGGLINIKENAVTAKMVELFDVDSDNIVKMKQWKHGVEFDKIENIEQLVRVWERERCRGDMLLVNEKYKISFLMVHGTIWEHIKKAHYEYATYSWKKSREITGREMFNEIVESFFELEREHKALYELLKAKNQFDADELADMCSGSVYEKIRENIYLERHCRDDRYILMFPRRQYEGLLDIRTKTIHPDLIDAFLDIRTFGLALQTYRKIPTLPAMMGSQNDDGDRVKQLALATIAIVDERDEARIEYDEEEGE